MRRYQWYGAPVQVYSWWQLADDLRRGLRVALAALAALTALVVGASSLPL